MEVMYPTDETGPAEANESWRKRSLFISKDRSRRVASNVCCQKRDPATLDLFLVQVDSESRQIDSSLPQAVAVT